jgi:hypothetical protein
MRSSRVIAFLVAATCAGLGGCQSDDIGVSTTFDPLARFPATATYAWDDPACLLPEDPRVAGKDVDALIREAADAEFARRGYRSVGPGASSRYLLSYQFAVHTWTGPDVSNAIGSLSLQLAETASGRRVWSGFGRAEIHVGLSPEERRLRLQEAFARMLEEFPPSQRGDD